MHEQYAALQVTTQQRFSAEISMGPPGSRWVAAGFVWSRVVLTGHARYTLAAQTHTYFRCTYVIKQLVDAIKQSLRVPLVAGVIVSEPVGRVAVLVPQRP